MIAVIYTGSRYADWRLADNNTVLYGFRTTGINSYIQDEGYIHQLLNKNTDILYNAEKINEIYFFGAGASTPERQKKTAETLEKFFRNAKIEVNHDLLASAISTFGDEKGIIGIIGSGSNAAYYDGKSTLENNYGLGYILADEGSTNWLAIRLLKDFLTHKTPDNIQEILLHKHNLDRKTILEKTYNHPNPNVFLTSFTDLFFENREDPYIFNKIKSGIELYINRYLLPLSRKHPENIFNFTGSVAYNFPELLRSLAEKNNIQVGSIIREPIQNLIKYYINKN
ncbi:MAG TPA: hypothetical protein VK102_00050 [Sphingobacterium sp.]|nr:hypothetical protein [Sphingobacterium sp.]